MTHKLTEKHVYNTRVCSMQQQLWSSRPAILYYRDSSRSHQPWRFQMNKRQINAERRRKGEGPVGRAEAPRRDTGGGTPSAGMPSGGYQSGGTPRPSLSGGGLSTRGKQAGGCGSILVIILIIGYYLLTGGGGLDLGGLTGVDDTGGGDGPASSRSTPNCRSPTSLRPCPPREAGRPGRSCSTRTRTTRCWNATSTST